MVKCAHSVRLESEVNWQVRFAERNRIGLACLIRTGEDEVLFLVLCSRSFSSSFLLFSQHLILQ